MYIDFMDLNKACPKDDFPLTRIEVAIDSAAGCEMMSLLDCFSGFHQLWLRADDQEKTSFITPFGTFCFIRMPEGLSNASPTFCRMVAEALKDQLGRNILTYVDDIVVFSKKQEHHIKDLVETFVNMRWVNLKMNPAKCVFGVHKGKMLGCLVSAKGIEANLDKINAIINMRPPQNQREVQKLTGCIAALNRFIARSAV
jgi:hypothetical protein